MPWIFEKFFEKFNARIGLPVCLFDEIFLRLCVIFSGNVKLNSTGIEGFGNFASFH